MAMMPSKHEQGFSLIEVMVALVLMAVVSLVSWRGLESVVGIKQYVERDAQRDDAIARVMGQLERDVQMRAPAYVLQDGASPASLLPAAITVTRQNESGLVLDIVREADAQLGGWQRVRWWRESGQLRRAIAPASDRYPLTQPDQGVAVLDSVSDFVVRAYVPGRGWSDLPAEQSTQEASGIAFTLVLPAASGSAPEYRKVVSLP